jgi:hypothetical protein
MVATAENLFFSALRLRSALGAGLEDRKASLSALQRLQVRVRVRVRVRVKIKGQP